MIEFKLIRTNIPDKVSHTTGELYARVKGEYYGFIAYTIEPKIRQEKVDGKVDKVYGSTAIPTGIYEGFLRMSPSRGRLIPELKDVPQFKHIQIHSGNSVKDTDGCILVGDKLFDNFLSNSRKTEGLIVDLIE